MQIPSKGRPSKLYLEDQALICFSFWREYWILFQVPTSYVISESSVSRVIRQVEDTLIQSGLFNLSKGIPEAEGIDWNVVILDTTEIPIQRSKK